MGARQRLSYFEVRVGSVDTGNITGRDHDRVKMCHNHLCFRADEPSYAANGLAIDIDCVSPIQGKYITVQKYGGDLVEKNIGISEIEVITYCDDPPVSANVCPTVSEDSDECTLDALNPGMSDKLATDCAFCLDTYMSSIFAVTYLGCYRVYDVMPFEQGQDTVGNTPISCAANCLATDPTYKYAGVRGGSYCHCSATFSGALGDESLCNGVCPGDSTKACGFNFWGGVYAINNANFRNPTKMTDKATWTVTGSEGNPQFPQDADPMRLADGDISTFYRSSRNDYYNWVQVSCFYHFQNCRIWR